jgi:2-oxoglutarate dehydrogenase E2 component (dihydrolipoamide succinyltransferase)
MSQVEIRLPKMGESVTEATITNWIKGVGDTIEIDEPLVEVATDKVDNELPSEFSGTVAKIFFEVDEVAQVGDVIALISTNGEVADTNEENKEVVNAAETVEKTVTNAVAAVSNNDDLDKKWTKW